MPDLAHRETGNGSGKGGIPSLPPVDHVLRATESLGNLGGSHELIDVVALAHGETLRGGPSVRGKPLRSRDPPGTVGVHTIVFSGPGGALTPRGLAHTC